MQINKIIKLRFHIWTVLPRYLSGKESTKIPGSGRPTGEENGNLVQYSCLGNPMDRGAWQTVHGVTKESDMTKWLNNKKHTLQHEKLHPKSFRFQMKRLNNTEASWWIYLGISKVEEIYFKNNAELKEKLKYFYKLLLSYFQIERHGCFLHLKLMEKLKV